MEEQDCIAPTITYIYVLVDPRYEDKIRYVGKAKNPNARLTRHIREARTNMYTTYKDNWIRQLLADEVLPKLVIIEEIVTYSNYDWVVRERYWIAKYKEEGNNLTNATDGGEGMLGHKRSLEAIRKTSEANIGRRHTDETKEIISQKAKLRPSPALGAVRSDETRAKMSLSSKGRKKPVRTAEHCSNISKALTGKPKTAEHIDNMRNRPAQVFSQEHRDKISAFHKGKPKTAEQVAKRIATQAANGTTNLGKKWPKEVIDRREATRKLNRELKELLLHWRI